MFASTKAIEWRKKFYPVEANKVSEKDAIQHSLTKWIGARKENLGDLENPPIHFYSSSCALCWHYIETHNSEVRACLECPLFKLRGKPCDQCIYGEENVAPFHAWLYGNPEPMIELLERALAAQEAA
jgi:hypothetical protein